MRTTRKQLESMVENLAKVTGLPLELEYRGSSYQYRYAVSTNGGSAFPFGERYWTAGDLWEALVLAHRAAQVARENAPKTAVRTGW